MKYYQRLPILIVALLFAKMVFSQVGSETFQFAYNDINYRGLISLPSQQVKGLIILIPGHGPTDFVVGEEYKELMEAFTADGFAVCAWDKAGCGQSGGQYDHNQSIESSAEEAIAAISELKRLNVAGSDRIGLWGISRAGWICPLIIEKEPAILFWITVSGTDEFENSRYMLEANLRAEKRSEAEIDILMKEWDVYQRVLVRGGESFDDFVSAIATLMKDPYFNPDDFQFTPEIFLGVQKAYQNNGVRYDDSTNLAIMVDNFGEKLTNVDIPVLAIFGEKDSQVDWRSTRNLYSKTIGGSASHKLTIKTFPDGNHTIQKCESGGVNESLEKFGNKVCSGYYETMLSWLNTLAVLQNE